MIIDLGYHLDVIEVKLKHERSLTNEDEVQLLKQIIESFHKLWTMSRKYPTLKSLLDNGSLRDIYDDMSSEFGKTVVEDSESKLFCGYCKVEFSRNNKDAAFAFLMHEQTPKHIEAVNNFKTRRARSSNEKNEGDRLDAEVLMNSDDGSKSNSSAHIFSNSSSVNTGRVCRKVKINTSSAPLDQWIFTHGNGKYSCNLCEAWSLSLNGLKEHVDSIQHKANLNVGEVKSVTSESNISTSPTNESENVADRWTQVKKDNKRLDLLKDTQKNQHFRETKYEHRQWTSGFQNPPKERLTDLKSKEQPSGAKSRKPTRHVFSVRSRLQVPVVAEPSLKERFPPETNPKNSIDTEIVSPEFQLIYQVDPAVRLAYFLNKTCIFRPLRSKYYACALCGTGMMDESSSAQHLEHDDVHCAKVNEIIRNRDSKSATFEVAILPGKRGNDLKCFLCDLELPGSNPSSYSVHLQTEGHEKMVNAHFKSPRFQDWEKGVILKNGIPYCVYCRLSLPTDIAMQQHVTDPSHKRKF